VLEVTLVLCVYCPLSSVVRLGQQEACGVQQGGGAAAAKGKKVRLRRAVRMEQQGAAQLALQAC
jgi:hypothetical protein